MLMSMVEFLLVLLPRYNILQIWARQIFVKKIPKFGVDKTTELNIVIYANIVTAVGITSRTKF